MEGNNDFIHDTQSIFVLNRREPCTDRGNFRESKNKPGTCTPQLKARRSQWCWFVVGYFFPISFWFFAHEITDKMFWLLQLRPGKKRKGLP